MVERAESGRELCLFDNRRLNEEELIQTHKNRTPPRERNAQVASGDFKKTELIDERLEDKGAIVSLAPQTHNTDPFVPAILSPSRYCTVPNLILLLIINTDT